MIQLIMSLTIAWFALSFAHASTSSNVTLTGYVRSFDEKRITIESGNQRYVIPRQMYPAKMRSGELISIPLTESEFGTLKHQTVTRP